MATFQPCVWYVCKELLDILDLFPHVGNGELRPLCYLHGGDLEVPEDVLFSTKDLMEKSNGAILFLWEEDILKKS